MGPTVQLAEFVSRLRYDQLPVEVISKTKECILDQLGVQLVASSLEWSRITHSTMKALGGNPESTIVNFGDKMSAPSAAFVNGTFGHGCELDDHGPIHGHGHPGCNAIPPAIAMGEKTHATGKDLITAVVAGYEILARISVSASRSILRRGFHSPWWVFGSAAAAAKILNMNTDRLVNAFGIAGSFAGGLGQFDESGGQVKRLHAGKAGYHGILSVLLAQSGFTAPPDILEGKSGLIKAFADKYSLEPLTKGLGKEWLILETGFKLYPCCGMIHPFIETASRLAEANRFGAKDIKLITIKGSSRVREHLGNIYEPHDTGGAQFSLPFSLGLTLVKGLDKVVLGAYLDEALWRDPEIMALARKVVFEVDPEADKPYAEYRPDLPHKFGSTIILTLKDGRELKEKPPSPRGTPPGEPLTWQEVAQKFNKNASSVLPAKQVQLIVETVDRLDTLGDVSELITHLCT